MTLRVSFGEIIEAVRAEARLSTNTTRGTDHLEYIKQIIKRNYEALADNYTWQHLRLSFSAGTKTLNAGQRFYDFPTTLNIGKIEKVSALNSGVEWVELEYGIGADEMNQFDSEADERCDPPLRWDFESVQQFEIWPIPLTAGSANFKGQRKISRLETEDSLLDMDDILVTLYSAGEMLMGTKQSDAEAKLAAAKDRLLQLRADYSPKTRVQVGMGRQSDKRDDARHGSVMYVRG